VLLATLAGKEQNRRPISGGWPAELNANERSVRPGRQNQKSGDRFELLGRQNRKTDYAQAGFTQNTLQTPTSMEGRQALLADLATFFSQQSGWVSKDPEISATILHTAANQLKSALDREANHERSHRTLIAAREEAGARVRARLRSLMDEASIGLSDDDARWSDFGCESPAAIRAAKPVRDLKSQTKAGKAQERKYDAGIRRAEIAKIQAEKKRVRAEKAQRDADRLRAEADEAIAFAEELFAKANQLKPGANSTDATSTVERPPRHRAGGRGIGECRTGRLNGRGAAPHRNTPSSPERSLAILGRSVQMEVVGNG